MKKYMERRSNPTVGGICDEGVFELCEDPIPQLAVDNFLKIIGSKTITCNNSFPMSKRVMLYQRQVNYVEYIIVTRDTANLGMSRKEVIQVISDI